MKRNVCFILIFILLGSVIVIITMQNHSKVQIGNFSIDDYESYIQQFPSSLTLGEISNEQDAIKYSVQVWNQVYGDAIKDYKPYKVSFDQKSDIWLVEGSLPNNMVGGVPYILIQKSSGKVLAIWHTR
jgi:hypothetical protein